MASCNNCVKKRHIVVDSVIIGGYCVKDHNFENVSTNETINLSEGKIANAHGKSLSLEYMQNNNCPQFKKVTIRKEKL
jgi:hypothetical protein